MVCGLECDFLLQKGQDADCLSVLLLNLAVQRNAPNGGQGCNEAPQTANLQAKNYPADKSARSAQTSPHCARSARTSPHCARSAQTSPHCAQRTDKPPLHVQFADKPPLGTHSAQTPIVANLQAKS